MPRFYHGTRLADAQAMQGDGPTDGGIDVTRGGGEFGRGFYTQDAKSNALSFVQNKFPAREHPCLLQLDLEDAAYDSLDRRELDARSGARLTRRLRSAGTTATHLEGVDVVVGPLGRWARQQKFESAEAQSTLNSIDTRRTIL